jgi:frataxin-like iron-binding protein CyaY
MSQGTIDTAYSKDIITLEIRNKSNVILTPHNACNVIKPFTGNPHKVSSK